jgi:hypothetical protein
LRGRARKYASLQRCSRFLKTGTSLRNPFEVSCARIMWREIAACSIVSPGYGVAGRLMFNKWSCLTLAHFTALTPITAALLRLEPLWDSLRTDPCFPKALRGKVASPPRDAMPQLASSKSNRNVSFVRLQSRGT